MSGLGVETTILAFYAAMMCGLISNTVCRRAQHVLHNNVIARHATALSVLFFISALVEFRNPDMSVWRLTAYTTGAYLWFLMSAQGPFLIFVSGMKLMIVAYMCRVYARWLDERKEKGQENDDVAESGAVAELKWLGKDPATFRRASDAIGIGAICVGFISFIVFLIEQRIQHKGNVIPKLIDYATGRSSFVVAKPLSHFLM